MSEPKYPNIKVKLVGNDGNAYSILGNCQRAMRKSNLNKTEIDQFIREATSGDYDNLLQTCVRWFDVR